jgi:hypothetical protein
MLSLITGYPDTPAGVAIAPTTRPQRRMPPCAQRAAMRADRAVAGGRSPTLIDDERPGHPVALQAAVGPVLGWGAPQVLRPVVRPHHVHALPLLVAHRPQATAWRSCPPRGARNRTLVAAVMNVPVASSRIGRWSIDGRRCRQTAARFAPTAGGRGGPFRNAQPFRQALRIGRWLVRRRLARVVQDRRGLGAIPLLAAADPARQPSHCRGRENPGPAGVPGDAPSRGSTPARPVSSLRPVARVFKATKVLPGMLPLNIAIPADRATLRGLGGRPCGAWRFRSAQSVTRTPKRGGSP